MKNLKKYGDMFNKLNCEIMKDIKNKTEDELKEIELEARNAKLGNCEWGEYKISRVVLSYVFFVRRERHKVKHEKKQEPGFSYYL
ncbi:MAG: hypothetical protein ACM3X7_02980 [Solirubrobacterales bacterium]